MQISQPHFAQDNENQFCSFLHSFHKAVIKLNMNRTSLGQTNLNGMMSYHTKQLFQVMVNTVLSAQVTLSQGSVVDECPCTQYQKGHAMSM